MLTEAIAAALGILDVPTDLNEDHRIRVARERRERMMARLLNAVMACYAEHVTTGPPSVDEVIARADVSRATFYKYFTSVDEAIERHASDLVDEMIVSYRDLLRSQMRPVLLFTASVHLFHLRAVLDPVWAAFVARSNLLKTDSILFNGVTRHLVAAVSDQDLSFSDVEAARILAVGTMRETVRSIAQTTKPRREFVDGVMTMILVGLGCSPDNAASLVKEATIFIRGAAPDRLAWWRDPWSMRPDRTGSVGQSSHDTGTSNNQRRSR